MMIILIICGVAWFWCIKFVLFSPSTYFILSIVIQCQCQSNVNPMLMSISIERIHIYHLLLIMWMLSLCLKLILMFRFFCLLSIRYIEPAFPNVFFSLSTSSRILFLISVYFIALPPLLPLWPLLKLELFLNCNKLKFPTDPEVLG